MMTQSHYQLGWLQACISAGHSTRRLTRALNKQGWFKIQPRLWARPGVKAGDKHEHIDRLRGALPPASTLQFIWFTDKQWGDSIAMFGPNHPATKPTP